MTKKELKNLGKLVLKFLSENDDLFISGGYSDYNQIDIATLLEEIDKKLKVGK